MNRFKWMLVIVAAGSAMLFGGCSKEPKEPEVAAEHGDHDGHDHDDHDGHTH